MFNLDNLDLFGSLVYQARITLKINADTLAASLGVSRRVVYDWEKSRSFPPSKDKMSGLAELLGLSEILGLELKRLVVACDLSRDAKKGYIASRKSPKPKRRPVNCEVYGLPGSAYSHPRRR